MACFPPDVAQRPASHEHLKHPIVFPKELINTLGNLDITTVVVGGGVSQAGEIYWEPLRRHVKNESRYSGFLNDIILRPAELHRDAGLIGAALGVLDGNSVLV